MKKGAEIDSYVPSNTKIITKMLAPLEIVLRKTCYVNTKSRGLNLMALKLVNRGKPIQVRHLKLIEGSLDWAINAPSLALRFESHWDGVGMDNLMNNDQPEKVIWEHLKFIQKNYMNLKDEASHRRLMVFDENSRVETFTAFPASVIKQHKERHQSGEKVYVGPTRHQLRKGWKEGDVVGDPN